MTPKWQLYLAQAAAGLITFGVALMLALALLGAATLVLWPLGIIGLK